MSVVHPFNPRPMSPRVRLALELQGQQVDRLMRVLSRLAVQGFAPIAFASGPVDGISVEVEEPADDLLDGRSVTGVFNPGAEDRMWFFDDGIKVHWYVLREAS